MNKTSEYIVIAVRMLSGLLLLLIGLHNGQISFSFGIQDQSQMFLFETGVSQLDTLARFLFLCAGVFIMLGVRTRLTAAFMLLITLFLTIECIATHEPLRLSPNLVMTGLLLACLSVLVIRGGGTHAIFQRGWQRVYL